MYIRVEKEEANYQQIHLLAGCARQQPRSEVDDINLLYRPPPKTNNPALDCRHVGMNIDLG